MFSGSTLLLFISLLLLLLSCNGRKEQQESERGADYFFRAEELYDEMKYDEAAELFWKAVLFPTKGYTVEEAMRNFFTCYQKRDVLDQGFVYVARRYYERGEMKAAFSYLEEAMRLNPNNADTNLFYAEVLDEMNNEGLTSDITPQRKTLLNKALELEPDNAKAEYELGQLAFNNRNWLDALKHLSRSCELNKLANKTLTRQEACAAAIYLRVFLADWGPGGVQFYRDMNEIKTIIENESVTFMLEDFATTQQSVVHPHMTLSYTISPELKYLVAKSHSKAERVYAVAKGGTVFDASMQLKRYKEEAKNTLYALPRGARVAFKRNPTYRIRVGYICASIKSKAIMYLVQDLLRFHNRDAFEVHVFATSGPDHPSFLKLAMGGVDWRQKVARSVEYFHDCSNMDFIRLASTISDKGIHILVDWDGYSHNGIRVLGVLALQPAPIQISMQEYIGTLGADYVQYIVADKYSLPVDIIDRAYSEKAIFMPSASFVNSMPYIKEIKPPSVTKPDSPQRFGCGGKPASFVFCNFNKHLKFNPEVFRLWINLLESVDNSVLCMLENPIEAVPNIRAFVDSENRTRLQSRIRFLPFIENPFDNQKRVQESCDLLVDTPVYNSHTTAVDALWGGVPIVAFGSSEHFSGRLCASILNTLGLTNLIAKTNDEYFSIALRMAQDYNYYSDIRLRLVKSCIQGNPFWDLGQYMIHFEKALANIWREYLQGLPLKHIDVIIADDLVTEHLIIEPSEVHEDNDVYDDDKDYKAQKQNSRRKNDKERRRRRGRNRIEYDKNDFRDERKINYPRRRSKKSYAQHSEL